MSLTLLSSEDGKVWEGLGNGGELFVKGTNAKQYFDVRSLVNREEEGKEVGWLRFELKGSTDDYGRVTIYQAEIFAVDS